MPTESAAARRVAAVRDVLRGRFFYGWRIVFVAFVADFMSAGIGGYSLGIFFKPMTAGLGVSRASLASVNLFRGAASGISGPIIGPLVDRYGARIVMMVGAAVAGVALMSISRIGMVWHFYLLFGVVGGLGLVEFGGLVTNAAIAKWFIRRRGRAIAFASVGISVGGMVMVWVSQILINALGWRGAWVVLGLLIMIVVIPVTALFMRRRPEDMGLLPDGEVALPKARGDGLAGGNDDPLPVGGERSWTLKEALKTRSFWLLVPTFALGGLSMGTVLQQSVAYVTDKGFSPEQGALILSAIGLFMALSKLLWGFLSEKFPVRYCVIAMYLGGAVGLIVLVNAQTIPMLLLFAATYGLTLGGTAVLSAMAWANYFGREFIGTIRGVTMPAQFLSNAVGPLFAGYVWDVTGDYRGAFTVFIVTPLLGAFFMWLAKPPRMVDI